MLACLWAGAPAAADSVKQVSDKASKKLESTQWIGSDKETLKQELTKTVDCAKTFFPGGMEEMQRLSFEACQKESFVMGTSGRYEKVTRPPFVLRNAKGEPISKVDLGTSQWTLTPHCELGGKSSGRISKGTMDIQVAAEGIQSNGPGKAHVMKLYGYHEPMLCGTFDAAVKVAEVQAERQKAITLTVAIADKTVKRGQSFFMDVTVTSSYDGPNALHFNDCSDGIDWDFTTPVLVSRQMSNCHANIGHDVALTKDVPTVFHSKVDVNKTAPLGILKFSVKHRDECGLRCKKSLEIISPEVQIEVTE